MPSMRATAGALSALFFSLLGFGLGPFCVGVVSDALAPSFGAQSLRYAMLVPLLVIPWMVYALYAARRTLLDDLRAADATAVLPDPVGIGQPGPVARAVR